MSQSSDAVDDRLIFLAEALALVPFSEATLRRAIARGELEAWQPSREGKLVMWRSALVDWATRRPAAARQQREGTPDRRPAKPERGRRGTARATEVPDPITLADLA